MSKNKKTKKPRGWRAFNELARFVAQVPKEQVDEAVEKARREHPRAKPRKKK